MFFGMLFVTLPCIILTYYGCAGIVKLYKHHTTYKKNKDTGVYLLKHAIVEPPNELEFSAGNLSVEKDPTLKLVYKDFNEDEIIIECPASAINKIKAISYREYLDSKGNTQYIINKQITPKNLQLLILKEIEENLTKLES